MREALQTGAMTAFREGCRGPGKRLFPPFSMAFMPRLLSTQAASS